MRWLDRMQGFANALLNKKAFVQSAERDGTPKNGFQRPLIEVHIKRNEKSSNMSCFLHVVSSSLFFRSVVMGFFFCSFALSLVFLLWFLSSFSAFWFLAGSSVSISGLDAFVAATLLGLVASLLIVAAVAW